MKVGIALFGITKDTTVKEILFQVIHTRGLEDDLENFNTSIKLTVLRKILLTTPDWLAFPQKYKIDRIMLTEVIFCRFLLDTAGF